MAAEISLLSTEEEETDNPFAQWFKENTLIVSVDTAVQDKDRFDLKTRTRTVDRAAFLLAKKLLEAGAVATTVLREKQGDVIRLQVNLVRPETWCPTHQQVFDVSSASPG